jgi:hypothetical protein
MSFVKVASVISASLLLVACNNQTTEAPAAGSDAKAPAGTTMVGADAAARDGLARYVGKYPYEKVGAHSWQDDPAVIAAVTAAVPDAAVRKWILEKPGPSTPISLYQGKVASWACEKHNCTHNWVTIVDPKSGVAEICYVDEEALPGEHRWFRAGKEERGKGACPETGSPE